MAVAEEKGGAPAGETYEEYLARQYAEGNVYSTGNGDASNYAYGQAAVNNGAPPPESTGLPTQQQTLDYYASQSINDYGPPPQPQYVPTQTNAGSQPPPPIRMEGMLSIPGWLNQQKNETLTGWDNLITGLTSGPSNFVDRSNPLVAPADPNPPSYPVAGEDTRTMPTYEQQVQAPLGWDRYLLDIQSHPIAPARLYPPYWLDSYYQTGEFPQTIQRRRQRREERRADRGKPPRDK